MKKIRNKKYELVDNSVVEEAHKLVKLMSGDEVYSKHIDDTFIDSIISRLVSKHVSNNHPDILEKNDYLIIKVMDGKRDITVNCTLGILDTSEGKQLINGVLYV